MADMIFKIDSQHVEHALEWIREHKCTIRGKYQGAIGGAITYTFTSTSIGEMQNIECACGQTELLNGDEL